MLINDTESPRTTYDEYGLPNTTMTGRFGYTGQKFLSEVGLYDYKARIYSPTLGRFMSPDPTGYGPGMNLYAYANNNPANNKDPTGLDYHYTIGSSTTQCFQDPGDLGFGGNPDISDDLSARYDTTSGNCYTTGQNTPISDNLETNIESRFGDELANGLVPGSQRTQSSSSSGSNRRCNVADYASQYLKAGALVAATTAAVSVAVVAAAPAGVGVAAAATVGEVATVLGVGFTGGAVVADGVAGGFTSGFLSGLSSASDTGIIAAGVGGIGKVAAGFIGTAKSAFDFAMGPNCNF